MGTVEIVVSNQAPIGYGDGFSMMKNSTWNDDVHLFDNDNSDTPTAVLVSDVSHGDLTLNANGTFSYTPDTNYGGSDSFTYKAYDTIAYSSTYTINITVWNMLSATETGSASAPAATLADFTPILAAAWDRWEAAGLSSRVRELRSVTNIVLVNFSGTGLGGAVPGHSLAFDFDAAGHGWFFDATAGDDAEFIGRRGRTGLHARSGSAADGRIDALTVAMHEIGHLIGLDDVRAGILSGVMSETLGTSTRRLPTSADAAFANMLFWAGQPRRRR